MKKIVLFSICVATFFFTSAQKVILSSNGHTSIFQKIDTLFFSEYLGKKPSTKTLPIDSNFSRSLMQFENTFGFSTKTILETNLATKKLAGLNKIFATPFYVYSDGTLQAPTSTLFFKPKNVASVNADFSKYGMVTEHNTFKGFYYLRLNTLFYDNGDKIFSLCDSMYKVGLTLIIEPVFVRMLKLNTDPLYPNQWNIDNIGQFSGTPGADMHVADVWPQGYTGAGIKVAVIDLGVDLNHPDLQANLLPGFDATGNNSNGGPIYDDFNAHGTECAGIIASVQNNIGAVGVAYNANIIPIRFGTVAPPAINPAGSITTSDTWESNCFNFAVNNGADIISNSWGGGSASSQLEQAINNAVQNGRNGLGTIVLFAAGNHNHAIEYPSNLANVVAVAATSECDTRKRSTNNPGSVNPGVDTDPLGVSCDNEFWWGSNFGPGLDVSAPGVHISTTTLPPAGDYTNAYTTSFNGTSAATPNTAAVLALMLQANPNLTGQQARNILENTCEKVGGYIYQTNVANQPNGTWSNDLGYGRVNACGAVTQALSTILSIAGDANFCSGTSNLYTISNLPVGATVTWTTTPSGIATINIISPTTATLTRTGSGLITLTATIPSLCATNTVITTTVQVGPADASSGYYTINSNQYFNGTSGIHLQKLHSYIVSFTDPTGASSYSWSLSNNLQLQSGAGTDEATIMPTGTVGSNFSIAVQPVGVCGTGGGITITGTITSAAGGDEELRISPNPANSTINISYQTLEPADTTAQSSTSANKSTTANNTNPSASKTVSTSTSNINKVRIFDMAGKLHKTIDGTATKQLQINVSDLVNGIYLVEVTSGTNIQRQKVIVQH